MKSGKRKKGFDPLRHAPGYVIAELDKELQACRARREGDEMVCHSCGIRWALDEDVPPAAKCR